MSTIGASVGPKVMSLPSTGRDLRGLAGLSAGREGDDQSSGYKRHGPGYPGQPTAQTLPSDAVCHSLGSASDVMPASYLPESHDLAIRYRFANTISDSRGTWEQNLYCLIGLLTISLGYAEFGTGLSRSRGSDTMARKLMSKASWSRVTILGFVLVATVLTVVMLGVGPAAALPAAQRTNPKCLTISVLGPTGR